MENLYAILMLAGSTVLGILASAVILAWVLTRKPVLKKIVNWSWVCTQLMVEEFENEKEDE